MIDQVKVNTFKRLLIKRKEVRDQINKNVKEL